MTVICGCCQGVIARYRPANMLDLLTLRTGLCPVCQAMIVSMAYSQQRGVPA